MTKPLGVLKIIAQLLIMWFSDEYPSQHPPTFNTQNPFQAFSVISVYVSLEWQEKWRQNAISLLQVKFWFGNGQAKEKYKAGNHTTPKRGSNEC